MSQLSTGAGELLEFTSSPRISIPDGTPEIPAKDQLVIDHTGNISALNVYLDISHTYIGDLVVKLDHIVYTSLLPTMTSLLLIDRPGMSHDAEFGCDSDDIDVLLSDTATAYASDQCSLDYPAITGVARPDHQLSAFNGEGIGGLWRLSVADHSNADQGTLNSWRLEPVLVSIPQTLPGDANGDGVVDVADLGIVGANFNANNMQWVSGDFTGDGLVDVSDLGVLGANWSNSDLSGKQSMQALVLNVVVPGSTTVEVPLLSEVVPASNTFFNSPGFYGIGDKNAPFKFKTINFVNIGSEKETWGIGNLYYAQAIPEPATLSLLATDLLLVGRRRKMK